MSKSSSIGNATGLPSDFIIRPRVPRELLTCFIAERLWLNPKITSTFETILPALKDYGIVHSQVYQSLAPYFSALRDCATLRELAVFPGSNRIRFKPTILGTDFKAKAFNLLLRKELRYWGILQSTEWDPEKPREELPPLPVVPWLLYRGARCSDKKLLQLGTSKVLGCELLAEEASLCPWMNQRISPQSCERFARRLRKSLTTVREGRTARFLQANECKPELASTYPVTAIMFPNGIKFLGSLILSPEKVQQFAENLIFLAQKARLEERGYEVTLTRRKQLTKTELAQLGLHMAGIDLHQSFDKDHLAAQLGVTIQPFKFKIPVK